MQPKTIRLIFLQMLPGVVVNQKLGMKAFLNGKIKKVIIIVLNLLQRPFAELNILNHLKKSALSGDHVTPKNFNFLVENN